MTPHAAQRFEERVRPGLEFKAASIELCRLVREFGERVEVPAWLGHLEPWPGCYLVQIADGIVVVVRDPEEPRMLPQAVTVLTRAGIGDSVREQRGRWRRSRPSGRAVKRAKDSLPRDRRPRQRDWSRES